MYELGTSYDYNVLNKRDFPLHIAMNFYRDSKRRNYNVKERSYHFQTSVNSM